MKTIIYSESLATNRPTERGSVLVVALMCLLALFAITFAATKVRVASARDVEDTNTHAAQYWQARSGAATIQASLITDIPAVFDAEMLRAQIAVAGYPLPAFDPTNIAPNLSRPVLNSDGSTTNSNASDCTSLLGNLNTWAARKTVIAENYARDQVYKNQVPRNRPGREKHEPRLSHLLDLLKATPFKEQAARERSETLRISLESFRNDPWIDAPTHSDFLADSRLDVYEIDSLQNLPERVRQSMAFRIAAHVMRSIGRLNSDGTRSPVLLAFDEMWEVAKHYPLILNVIERAARTGGKENAVTLLASHAYEDFTGTKDVPNPIGIALAKTAGVKLIGKQVGDYSRLITETGLSPAAHACIEGIKNIPGQHAQFLAIIGSGQDKITEMLQVDLSPTELWTFTSNPDERNARARVQSLQPNWPIAAVIAWLAERYPRGLTAVGLTDIDETELTTKVRAA